jgi:hypothetical protein
MTGIVPASFCSETGIRTARPGKAERPASIGMQHEAKSYRDAPRDANALTLTRVEAGRPVSELVSDDALKANGYLALPFAAMEKAGSATQTIANIRSHWPSKRATFADEETIAMAACVDESTVRRRHLPKLAEVGYVLHRMINTDRGTRRREFYFTVAMKLDGYWDKNFASLPRWAALILPEWSQRVIYATVLQNSLAAARGSRSGPVALENEQVLRGEYGRHIFSLGSLGKKTCLSRNSVNHAKAYLIENEWLTREKGNHRGEELFINLDRLIPLGKLQEAYETSYPDGRF